MDWKNRFLYPLAKTAIHTISRTRLPRPDGVVRLKGPGAPVEILTDRWHIPHIFAKTRLDALFAQGYLHAQERLWQMDVSRRLVFGRLSEIVGAFALDTDRTMRTLGFRQVVDAEVEATEEPFCSLLKAYRDGVNAWMEKAVASRKLPVEFSLLGYRPDPWEIGDTFSIAKMMGWTLAGNWRSEFLRGRIIERLGEEKAAALQIDASETWAAILDAAGTGLEPTRRVTGAQAGEGVGSNNWVLHGTRTATGAPLLANDMHLELSAPPIWYENHLACDEFEVSGLSIPGAPMVITGHNRHVAWGFTDGLPDVQDLYEEHLRTNPDGQVEYEFTGEWHPVEIRREEIRVKGGSPVTQEVLSTRHGPLVNVLFDKAYPDAPPLAMRWTALEPETTLQAIFDMNQARTCADFHEALRLFSGPSQNVVYADTQGNIGYTLHGRIPIRANGCGSVPAPGWTGEYEWTGYIPFEALPHMENPSRGFIATANNHQVREEGEYFLGCDYCSSDRAARITELLEAQPRVDIDCIKKMQFDQVSLSARELARHLGRLSVSDPGLSEIVRQMRDWDGDLAADSAMAVIYQVTIRSAIRRLLDHHLGDLGIQAQGKGVVTGLWAEASREWFIHLLNSPDSPWFDLGGGEQRDDLLASALAQAVDFLKQELGPEINGWSWGKLHTLTFRHHLGSQALLDGAFNLGPYPLGGDGTTIWAAGMHNHDLSQDGMTGPPYRFIADLSDIDHCWGMLAPGQSGHPASPHYRDGIQPWLTGEYHPVLVRRDEIEQNLKNRMRIEPE
jgi:penicillin G amidase